MRRNFMGATAFAVNGAIGFAAQTDDAQPPTATNGEDSKTHDLRCPNGRIQTGSWHVVLPSADRKLRTTTYVICKTKSR